MSYEEEFKKINNQVYNMNKDRREPFGSYYISIKENIQIDTEEPKLKRFFINHPIKKICASYGMYNRLSTRALKETLDQNIEVLNKKEQLSDKEKALLDSLKIDLEDYNKFYHKDMKRKFIE